MNYVTLFSSAGIGCYGLKEAGFTGVSSVELLPKRLQIQKFNNKLKYKDGYILGDITSKDIKEELYKSIENYKEKSNENSIDVVIFTAPCQGMSVANHKKVNGDIERNSLVIDALDIVNHINPRFFICENVKTFLNTKCVDHNKNKKIKDALSDHLSQNYNYESKVINFKEYGANSSRTRTIVIGVRKDVNINPISLFPEKEKSKNLKQVIGYLPQLNEMGEISKNDIYHEFKPYRKDMRDWIHDLKPGHSSFENKDERKRPHRIINGKLVPNVNKNGSKYTRQRWDKVAPCVHTRNDILASQNTIHPSDDRVFSIRELMNMMNIPNEFKWSNKDEKELNKLSIEEKRKFLKENEMNIRQSIGEAIPPVIIYKIALKIKQRVKKIE